MTDEKTNCTTVDILRLEALESGRERIADLEHSLRRYDAALEIVIRLREEVPADIQEKWIAACRTSPGPCFCGLHRSTTMAANEPQPEPDKEYIEYAGRRWKRYSDSPCPVPADKINWWYRIRGSLHAIRGTGTETIGDQSWLMFGQNTAIDFALIAGWERAPTLAGPWEAVTP